MLSLEEYFCKRKREDGINEKDKEKRMENLRICSNYLFEYFLNYMDTVPEDEVIIRQSQKAERYFAQLSDYSPEIREWLVDIYEKYGKQVNRTILNMIDDDLFLLYDSDAEYRALSYKMYSKVVKKMPFLEGQSENLFLLLRDIHTHESSMDRYQEKSVLPSEVSEWVFKTYSKYGVNIYAFCFSYLDWFWNQPEIWPKNRKMKSEYTHYYTPRDPLYWSYDCRSDDNRFNINELYRRMPKKPFIKGQRLNLEAAMMYIWLFEIGGSDSQFWSEYLEEYEQKQQKNL